MPGNGRRRSGSSWRNGITVAKHLAPYYNIQVEKEKKILFFPMCNRSSPRQRMRRTEFFSVCHKRKKSVKDVSNCCCVFLRPEIKNPFS
jgi:hypothetical protein